MQPRILAVDLGEKRVGLAVSDPLGSFPVGLDTYTRIPVSQHLGTPWDDVVAHVVACMELSQASVLVIGLPRNMDGSEGKKAQESRAFAEAFSEAVKTTHPDWIENIQFEDERLSSVVAQQHLHAAGIKPSRNKGRVDQTAAMVLVEAALLRRQHQANR